MDKHIQHIQSLYPDMPLKIYSFIELDYDSIFPEVIPASINTLRGQRVWINDNGSYSIQEGVRFTENMSFDEVVRKLANDLEFMQREEEIRKRDEEKKRMAILQAMAKRAKQEKMTLAKRLGIAFNSDKLDIMQKLLKI